MGTYFDDVYLPQKKKEIEEWEELYQQQKKKISPFRLGFLDAVTAHQREHLDKLWDLALDVYTKLFIVKANEGEEEEIPNINLTLDEEGNVIDYYLKDPKKAWEEIQEQIYTDYLQFHVGTHLYRDAILAKVKESIKMRIPFVMKLLWER
jgi:hypothetical protein